LKIIYFFEDCMVKYLNLCKSSFALTYFFNGNGQGHNVTHTPLVKSFNGKWGMWEEKMHCLFVCDKQTNTSVHQISILFL
jgi:hypothetical protein